MKALAAQSLHVPLWFRAVLWLATIAGILAVAQLFAEGHIITNATQHIPWGLWVATYIYFIGISAGAFLLSSLIYVFRMKQFEAAGPVALMQAFLCMIIAGLFIFLDLGHPFRMYQILFSMNLTSVMAWMGVFYVIYLVIIAFEIYYSTRNDYIKHNLKKALPEELLSKYRKYLFILGLIGIPIAIGVHGGVGSIFAVAKARPNWYGGLFPIVFIISALASGGGLLTYLCYVFLRMKEDAKARLMQSMLNVSMGFLVFDFLLLLSEILTTFYGGISHETTAWRMMIFGTHWYIFWILQVGIGLVFPLYVAFGRTRWNSTRWLSYAGLAMALGVYGTRLNIVIPAQFAEALDGISEAYHHIRFESGYFPSVNEFAVGIGGVAAFIWLLLLANRYLPLNKAAADPKPVEKEIGILQKN